MPVSASTKDDIWARVGSCGETWAVWMADAHYSAMCVFRSDAAMSLPQSYLGAAPQAKPGRTFRLTVTFKKKPSTDNLFATVSGFSAKPRQIMTSVLLLWAAALSCYKNVKNGRTTAEAPASRAAGRSLTAPSWRHVHGGAPPIAGTRGPRLPACLLIVTQLQ